MKTIIKPTEDKAKYTEKLLFPQTENNTAHAIFLLQDAKPFHKLKLRETKQAAAGSQQELNCQWLACKFSGFHYCLANGFIIEKGSSS